MKKLVSARAKSFVAVGVLLGLTAMLGTASAWAEEKHEYRVAGTFVEGCSCGVPCTCDISGAKHGCQGVGALVFTSGTYQGVDLAGAKLAYAYGYATTAGTWFRVYVDAKNLNQEKAVTEFAKAAYGKDFGKTEAVKKSSISLTGKDGRYTLSVDGGKVMGLSTEPVLGADNKTPISYNNVFMPISPTVLQGKTVKGSYHDDNRSLTLAGSNSFFNGSVRSSGKI